MSNFQNKWRKRTPYLGTDCVKGQEFDKSPYWKHYSLFRATTALKFGAGPTGLGTIRAKTSNEVSRVLFVSGIQRTRWLSRTQLTDTDFPLTWGHRITITKKPLNMYLKTLNMIFYFEKIIYFICLTEFKKNKHTVLWPLFELHKSCKGNMKFILFLLRRSALNRRPTNYRGHTSIKYLLTRLIGNFERLTVFVLISFLPLYTEL